MRPATSAEIDRWDELVVANPDGGHVLQGRAWGEFKRTRGWEPHHYIAELGPRELALLLLRRRFPLLGDLWYAPKGPGVSSQAELLEVTAAVRAHALGGFLFRFEPDLLEEAIDPAALQSTGLVKAATDIQINRATVLVDLRPAEDELLAGFKSKTRYNIRLATRKEVVVEAVPPEPRHLDALYSMMAATRDRAGFYLRPRDYYHGYWRLQAERGQGQLFMATYQGRPLSGAFVTHLGRKAWFKDGGSVREEQSRMPSYLLQWEVMRWLRSREVESYDLVGVPPRAQMTPQHNLFSLVQFKTGFSEAITEYIGTWDLPLSGRYRWWTGGGERLAGGLNRRLRGDLLW